MSTSSLNPKQFGSDDEGRSEAEIKYNIPAGHFPQPPKNVNAWRDHNLDKKAPYA